MCRRAPYSSGVKVLYLVRHAQSHPSDDVHHSEWPLSEVGLDQASRLGRLLADLDIAEIFSSPYRRCLQTIEPFAAEAELPIAVHDGLRERLVAHGWRDDFPEVWARSWADFSYALPGCESSADAQERICATVLDICERSTAATLAISSHGNVLSLLLNAIDARFDVDRATAMRNPDVYRARYAGGRLRWDDAFALPQLDPLASHFSETPVTRTRR